MAFDIWHYFTIAGIIFVVIEILTPTTFFINLALACFVTAIASVYTDNFNILIPLWAVASGIFMFLLRGLRRKNTTDAHTGLGRYIGQRARVIEPIGDNGGAISIFDERWKARSADGEKYESGAYVRIVKEENLVMFVEKEK